MSRRPAVTAAALLAVGAVVLAGCGTSQEHAGGPPATSSAPAVAPPAPSPVSTAASLTGNCVMGYEQYSDASGAFAGFTVGSPRGETVQGTYYAPALAYQLTLTNGSANTADVVGFAVVFYDAGGSELGSDQVTTTASFVTPGQSLTWSELASSAVDGSYGNSTGGNDDSIPAGAASCDLVQWYSGSGQ